MDKYDALMAYLAKESYEEAAEAQWPLELHERPAPAPERERVPEVSYELDLEVPF